MKRRLLYLSSVAVVALIMLCATLGVGFSESASAAPTGASSGADPGNAGQSPEISCADSIEEMDLGWIACPISVGLSGAVAGLDDIINKQMSIGSEGATSDPNQVFCDSKSEGNAKKSCAAYHYAWRSMRDIALGLMAIAGLVILIAQALGFEILDAYTIRKALPRLLIAAVAITVSWQLMQFAVTLSNDLGFGVRYLIYKPFSNINGPVLGGGYQAAVNWIAIVAGLTVLGWVGIVTYIAVALLAVGIAVLVLVLRQLLVIMLVILAPIAIVCYILPNTQKAYKLWWSWLSKALLMFVLISALIASGRAFASVASLSDSIITKSVGFIAYFLPYFALPFTFAFAGGLIAAAATQLQQRTQPATGWIGKKRTEKAAANVKKARSFQRWNQEFGRFKNPITGKRTSVGSIANRGVGHVLDADELAPYYLGKGALPTPFGTPTIVPGGVPGFKRGAAKVDDILDNMTIDQSSKLVQEIDQKGGMHYEAWRAVAGDYNGFSGRSTVDNKLIKDKIKEAGFYNPRTGEYRAPTSLKDFQTMSSILSESNNDKERLGGEDISRHEGTFATVKSQPDMEYADTQVAGLVGLAAAGRTDPQALADVTNSIGNRLPPGRAQRALKTAQKVGSRNRPDIRDGHGVILNANTGKYESAYSDKNYKSKTAVGSVVSVKGQDWTGAKAEAVKAAKRTLVHVATGGTGDVNEQETIQNAIMQGMTNPYSDAGQQKAWREVAEAAGMDIAHSTRRARVGDLPPEAPEPAPEPAGGGEGGAPPA